VNSLAQIAILGSYLMTISCLIWRRLRGAPLPPHPWSLGKWGLLVNVLAVCLLLPIFVFSAWPLLNPVTAANM